MQQNVNAYMKAWEDPDSYLARPQSGQILVASRTWIIRSAAAAGGNLAKKNLGKDDTRNYDPAIHLAADPDTSLTRTVGRVGSGRGHEPVLLVLNSKLNCYIWKRMYHV